MLKKLVIVVTLIICQISFVNAATIPDESAAKELANKIMQQVAAGNLSAAFKLMKPYVAIPESEFDSVALQSKSQRDQFGFRYGPTIGYEFVDSKKSGLPY